MFVEFESFKVIVVWLYFLVPDVFFLCSFLPMPAKIIVVGGGLAGLSATIEALRAGASVTLLDKTKS